MKTGKDNLRTMLAGGDRRSIGKANEAAGLVLRQSHKTADLIECLWDTDPCVCMRAADALEKISRERSDLLQSHAESLLGLLAETTQPEVRWHLALMIPRVRLKPSEVSRAAAVLQLYLEDRSSIVKTCAMQGLSDLAHQHAALRSSVIETLRSLTRTGTAAMRARGRILLREWEAAL